MMPTSFAVNELSWFLLLRRVMVQPPPGYFQPSGEPNPFFFRCILEKLPESVGPAGLADYPAVQPQRHHFWVGAPFFVKHVEAGSGDIEKVIGSNQITSPEIAVIDLQ